MKRKVPVAVAKGMLARVPFQVSFWLCTNENLRSLRDISEALQKATDDVFRYHVNRDKNDFETWIRDIIKDKDLAREIARVKTRDTLIRKITERVDELSSILNRSKTVKAKAKAKPKRKRKGKAGRARHAARPARPAKAKRKARKKLHRRVHRHRTRRKAAGRRRLRQRR
ncbi:hypothetical protein HYY73_02430 [Candidatus Woesearchaeota archaeon]|nr:hypothetical protein [Candidatus Woesearchaeota archaeon]